MKERESEVEKKVYEKWTFARNAEKLQDSAPKIIFQYSRKWKLNSYLISFNLDMRVRKRCILEVKVQTNAKFLHFSFHMREIYVSHFHDF